MTGTSKFVTFFQKIDTKTGGYLGIILCAAVVVLLLVAILVAAVKNAKIRALKKQLRERDEELAAEKARASRAEAFTPVVGGKALFGEESAPETPDDPSAERTEPEERAVRIDTPSSRTERERREEEEDAAGEDASVPPRAGSEADPVKYVVKYDRMKDSWVIKRVGSERVLRRCKTKEEALSEARAMCKRHNATLIVHKKDGKFQRQ